MAITTEEILAGITGAGFTPEEWATAQKVNKLTVELGLKRAEISNLKAWLATQNANFATKLSEMEQEAVAIEAAIQELAPSV